MLITFRTISQLSFQMDLDEAMTIGALKDQMCKEHSDFCRETLKLIYNGKVYNDDETIGQMNFDEKKFVVVMNPKKKPTPPAAAPAPVEPAAQTAEPSTSATETPTQEATTTVTATAPTQEATSTTTATETPAVATAPVEQQEADVPVEHNATVEAIMAMGYERPQVVLALKAAFFNADRAVEYLLSGIPANAVENVVVDAPEEVGEASMDFLDSPQFEELRQIVLENPAALPQIMAEIQQLNPDLLQFIRDNQALFLERLNAPPTSMAEVHP
uniref:UV excision repair protein RAD23 n=1 Tax=Steinernema glaseri TaxID=37863 RepID=A0A1I7ZDC0_9BILA